MQEELLITKHEQPVQCTDYEKRIKEAIRMYNELEDIFRLFKEIEKMWPMEEK